MADINEVKAAVRDAERAILAELVKLEGLGLFIDQVYLNRSYGTVWVDIRAVVLPAE